MESEEKDALWDLLGKADRRSDVSPAFAQNVARLARQMGKPKSGGIFARLFASPDGSAIGWVRPIAALGAIAALVIAVVTLTGNPSQPESVTPPVVENEIPSFPEPEVVVGDPTPLEVFEDEMEALEQFDTLLTVSNVNELADEEIAMLLY